MAIDKNVKKKVIEEWQNVFPQLTLYAQDKLYKVVGCVVIGIELIKLPRTEEYRPHFVVYPLWKKDVKECLDAPIILKEFYNKKRLQFNIPYEKHNLYFDEILGAIKSQAPLSFEGDILVKKLLSVMDEYSKTPPLSAAHNSYLQAKLKEAMLQISLYKGTNESKSIIEQINKINWNVDNFKYFGVDVASWLQGLQEKVTHREEFLKQITVNKQDKKIEKLKSTELTA